MLTLREEIGQSISRAVAELYPEFANASLSDVTPATARQFGHYQCNLAMRLATLMKQPPRSIAQALAAYLEKNDRSLFSHIEVAGPGFINLTLTDAYLIERASHFNQKALASAYPSERVLIDFSSPNTAKEMHVGHLRSTIIGDSLARIYEFLGFDILRVNHIGDWGTQFGMLIAYLLQKIEPTLIDQIVEESQHAAANSTSVNWDLSFLMEAYKQSKLLFDSDPAFATLAKQQVIALQAHEKVAYAIWQKICMISRQAYQQIYDLLDVRLTECGESFYNDRLAPMVKELTDRGFVQSSNGAKCIFIEGYELPLMVQKSDGGFNYDSTDLAAMRYRIEELKARRIIILTDAGQRLHFELIFAASRLVGYLPEDVKVTHAPFGLVLGPDGKKFKTRSGYTEKLIDLLHTAIERAREILTERGYQSGEELDRLAQALGINAVKYADLCNFRLSDYSFSYEKMLRFEGNTAAFLMYAYVRSLSVTKRCASELREPITLSHPSERQLLLTLLQLDEALANTLAESAPNRLAEYLYTLAQDFNGFFRDCRVEGSPEQASRLTLVELTTQVLGEGLQMLGLRLVEKM